MGSDTTNVSTLREKTQLRDTNRKEEDEPTEDRVEKKPGQEPVGGAEERKSFWRNRRVNHRIFFCGF